MKRMGASAALMAALALGAGTAMAAGGASIHLKAPSSTATGKRFRVTAFGHSPTRKGSQFVLVTFTRHARCASTASKTLQRGDFVVRFKNANELGFVRVSKGSYSVTSTPVFSSKRIEGLFCGYLYAGSHKAGSKPEARTVKSIKFTRPVSPSKQLSGAALN